MKIRGWRRERTSPSLEEVYPTIPVGARSPGRRLLAFLGPGYLVAVGYMDPGNWATDLVIPLVRFTSDRFKMGEFVNPWWLSALAWVVAVIIASLNAWLLIQTGMGWLER